MNVPTYEQIQPFIESGFVSEQVHPEDPDVRIFNYTQRCQFAREWNDVTRQCRGLILNVKTGEVIARPFPKFYNYQEHATQPHLGPIPSEVPVITEKYDGSLGILYGLRGKAWIATRGSFTSEQAVWATNWFRERYVINPDPEVTELFEIIYPENRIVVNYDYSGLVHLVTIDNETGRPEEARWTDPIRTAKVIPATSLAELQHLDEPNSEGFVAYYPKANVRIKLKFPEYVRLHKLITGVSEIAIWEHLRDGKGTQELLDKVPDEFFKWVESVEKRLMAEFAALWGRAQHAVMMLKPSMTRKEQALDILARDKQVSSVAFALLDDEGKRAAQLVWRMVRPRGNLPFKADIDL